MPPKRILVVEPSAEDFGLIGKALLRTAPELSLERCETVEQAIGFLQDADPAAPSKRGRLPGAIFVAINLPGDGGIGLVRWIRERAWLISVPVVMLVAPSEIRRVSQAYQAGANSFLSKPFDFEGHGSLSVALKAYGLYNAQPPQE